MVFSMNFYFRMNNVLVRKFLNVYIREEGTIKYCLRLFSNGEKNLSLRRKKKNYFCLLLEEEK